jgi:alpha-L-rhamnosidase
LAGNSRVPRLFSSKARWIWNESDRKGYNYFLRAKRTFHLDKAAWGKRTGSLLITAEGYYQVWINGAALGHGPAKSAENERLVDCYDIGGHLSEGENRLEVLVLSVGVGTLNYICGEAGLIFQIDLPGQRVVSDGKTLVQPCPRRQRKTARRWMLPCIEDVDCPAAEVPWNHARVVEKTARLMPRPVPLPGRISLVPQRLVAVDEVAFPTFSQTFRIKSYLVSEDQKRRCNSYQTPAFLITEIISPRDQELTFTPTFGNMTWYFNGRKLMEGSGWYYWDYEKITPRIHLKKGANRLVGVHFHNHFEEVHLAGFSRFPVRFRNPFGPGAFQIIPVEKSALPSGDRLAKDWADVLDSRPLPVMNPEHSAPDSNFQDLAVGARVRATDPVAGETMGAEGVWKLPPGKPGSAVRVIVDLGSVQNGWLTFSALGRKGSRLIFSLFEALEAGPPLRINWPEACNNALSFRLGNGRQTFESFHAYGGRYIAIHHEGTHPVELRNLALVSANCGGLRQGTFRSSDSRLNAIYSLCEQTVLSATDDTLTDCPTYEAVNWNFDNRLCAMADFATCRNVPVIRHTLEIFSRDPFYRGLVRSHYPSAWDNRIPIFCFHWIIACREFYWNTGELDFVRRMMPRIAAGLREAIGKINARGLLDWPSQTDVAPGIKGRDDEHAIPGADVWHIVDWHKERDDAHAIVSAEQAYFIGALEAAEYLAGVLKDSRWQRQAVRWRRARSSLKKAIEKHLWLEKNDAFVDSLHADGMLSPVSSQPSNAALAFFGVGTTSWRKRLAARIEENGAGLLPYGSPMGLFYVLEFLDQHGKADAIFRLIAKKWGTMIEAGDKTIWEHFPEFGYPRFPTRSRCHPFGAYILKYYVKYLLGIEARAPGFRKVRFRPRPPSGMTFCEGSVPSSHGDLRVRWTKKGAKIAARSELPQ